MGKSMKMIHYSDLFCICARGWAFHWWDNFPERQQWYDVNNFLCDNGVPLPLTSYSWNRWQYENTCIWPYLCMAGYFVSKRHFHPLDYMALGHTEKGGNRWVLFCLLCKFKVCIKLYVYAIRFSTETKVMITLCTSSRKHFSPPSTAASAMRGCH